MSGELSVRCVQRPVVTLYTTRFNEEFMFYPQSALKFLVCLAEQTVIIFLYTIKWFVFVRKMECVYCVVRTES